MITTEIIQFEEYTFHVAVFNGRCEIRHKTAKGLLCTRMDAKVWALCFAEDVDRAQLFTVILKWFYTA